MQSFLTALLLLFALAAPLRAQRPMPEKKPYVVYAEFLQESQVELTDGSVWIMDKGDCFPVYQFKTHENKVILQMSGKTTFIVDAERVKVLADTEKEKERALVTYRKNLAEFLNGRPDAWKKDAGTKTPPKPPKPPEPKPEAPK